MSAERVTVRRGLLRWEPISGISGVTAKEKQSSMRFMMRAAGGRTMVGGLALGATVLASGGLAALDLHATGARAAAATWVTTQGKIVHLTVTAGYNLVNSGFNFDGAANGQMTVTVPQGDTVDVTFTNKGQGAAHNVVIIPSVQSLPSSGFKPAFPGSASPAPKFRGGSPPGAPTAETFSFVAGKAGTYLMVCGIAGHALAGMWDTFIVSPTAASASVTFGAAHTMGVVGTTAPPSNTSQWVSTSGNVVKLALIAGYNGANSGFNFDGGAKGQMVVTVPLGDKIVATYSNAGTTGHDVLIVPYQQPLPTHSVPTAFTGSSGGAPNFGARKPGGAGTPGAGSPPPRRRQLWAPLKEPITFTFVANKAGTYLIICGFPGHAIAGMWDTFVVSPTAKVASISFK